MKVYAIFSEYGVVSIREELEMICISKEVAESYLGSNFYEYWRNPYIKEIDIVCDKYKPMERKTKKKSSKGRS